jgi:hypothetical protein
MGSKFCIRRPLYFLNVSLSLRPFRDASPTVEEVRHIFYQTIWRQLIEHKALSVGISEFRMYCRVLVSNEVITSE